MAGDTPLHVAMNLSSLVNAQASFVHLILHIKALYPFTVFYSYYISAWRSFVLLPESIQYDTKSHPCNQAKLITMMIHTLKMKYRCVGFLFLGKGGGGRRSAHLQIQPPCICILTWMLVSVWKVSFQR